MRLFYCLISLISFTAIAIPPNCDESDIVPGANLNTCTRLEISAPVNLVGSSGGRILITGISGNVIINHNIILDGADGPADVLNGNGGLGGPGAGDGGGFDFGTLQDGSIDDGFGGRLTVAADGKTTIPQNPCASGGGGGGFATVGNDGKNCTTSAVPNNGGDDSSAFFDFTLASFRGGFGGGSGAFGTNNSVGTAGGGGGSLHIEATGTITIASGVTISAKGGSGGDENTDGGGGGGGSGGAIWLISASGVINQGTIDVRGGSGGRNSFTGAHGGAGSSGRFRIESAGVVTEGTGISTPASRNPSSSSSSKLTSDISCGTISKKSDSQKILSIAIGFFLIFLLANIRKSKKLFFS